jgi:hypothetical protein
MKMKHPKACISLFFMFFILVITACQSVKPYQRAYLNDREMQFKNSTVENMELKAQAYREAAAGTGKGITSGGCGCK